MSTSLATVRNGEPIDAEMVASPPVATTPSALAPIIRAEMDAAILLAKQYPRSITQFLDRAMSYATLTFDTAKQCCYAVPRGGKTVQGPSVRLAEIIASTFGNIRVDARIIEERERYVVAQGVAQDLECNNSQRIEVRRSIWSNGNAERRIPPGRFNDDMINVTCNAAIAIARRNAILMVVPRAIYSPVYQACLDIVKQGDKSKPLATQRADWLVFFREDGFKDHEVFAALGIRGADDIGIEQLAKLSEFQTAIEDGETSWEKIFRPAAVEAVEVTTRGTVPPKTDRLVEKLGGGKGKTKQQPGEPAPAPGSEVWESGRE